MPPDDAHETPAAPTTLAHRGRARVGDRRLLIAFAIAVVTAVVQVIGGWVTGSVALLADALHVATDASALALAVLATWLARRPHSRRLTFGWHRAEVLAASFNAFLLLAIAAVIAWHAIGRLLDPRDVHGVGLLGVALFGLAANATAYAILHGIDSVNVRAARLHVLSDMGGSIAAVTAGVIVAATGWVQADPLLSLLIVLLVVIAALRLAWETAGILMAVTPARLDLREVEGALREVPGVVAVHDLHAWTITSGFEAFAAHVEVLQGHDVIQTVEACVGVIRERFGIQHVAIHPERAHLHQVTGPPEEPARR